MPEHVLQKAEGMPTTAPAIQTVQTASVQTAELAGQATAVVPAADAAVTGSAVAMTPVEGGMSIWDMFWKADLIVMVVMVMLIVTSIWCWTIIINKFQKVRSLNKQAESFEEAFWSGGSLDQLYERVSNRIKDPLTAVFASAMREWRRSVSKGFVASDLKTTMQQRIDRVMQVTIGREMEKIERHMGFLASVGSTAPFVGLFGTVWGIMNSFQSIAISQNTSLAVVAPGIAEALFVTALGLVAAIPAVIAFNKLSNDINRYGNRLDTFSSEFMSIISRQLEEED
jgi:biopolymer transport protein TolQ